MFSASADPEDLLELLRVGAGCEAGPLSVSSLPRPLPLPLPRPLLPEAPEPWDRGSFLDGVCGVSLVGVPKSRLSASLWESEYKQITLPHLSPSYYFVQHQYLTVYCSNTFFGFNKSQ